jgi:hypothetical protein
VGQFLAVIEKDKNQLNGRDQRNEFGNLIQILSRRVQGPRGGEKVSKEHWGDGEGCDL